MSLLTKVHLHIKTLIRLSMILELRSLKLSFDNDKALDKFFSYNVIFYIAYAVMIMVVYKLWKKISVMWEMVRGTRKRISVGRFTGSMPSYNNMSRCHCLSFLFFLQLLLYMEVQTWPTDTDNKTVCKYTFCPKQGRVSFV